jgi:tetraacyldisaccharide 4'-kinase
MTLPELPRARWFAEQLERGAWRMHPIARALSAFWASAADPVRPLELPESARVIGVGGATLGGSGKSTITLELARTLARGGARVAVVASAYPARDRAPRRVWPEDRVEPAGDEALWLARALEPDGVPVFIGAPREIAIARAAQAASIVIVDGLLQTRPRRLSLSLLALDAAAPWGSLRCPPAGDLRARRGRLLAASDAVLLATDPALEQPAAQDAQVQFYGKTAFRWSSELSGAWTHRGQLASLAQLRGLRLGLLLAVARPERIRSALAARGIGIHAIALRGDHAALKPPPGRGLDAWLTTAKCATKVGQIRASVPVWTLEHQARLPAEVTGRAAQFARETPVVWCAP